MEKSNVRSAIETLTPGDKITMAFVGSKASLSGEYEVDRLRVGRGKGGSQMIDLKASDGTLLSTGTPDSDEILHIILPDGSLQGYETEAMIPPVFETADRDTARTLRDKFAMLVSAYRENETANYQVTLVSEYTPFNGTFEAVSARQLRGRYGQVVLSLKNSDGDVFEVWSQRHSGIVSDFIMTEVN